MYTQIRSVVTYAALSPQGVNMNPITKLQDLDAHWLYINHNPRNNRRTKPTKRTK